VAREGGDPSAVIEARAPRQLNFPYEEEPLVSIIIPAHNQWGHTERCLRSILANTRGVPYEVIVGDDESEDKTQQLAEHSANVTVVRDGIWRGFLRTCNNASAHARGDYIVLLNNDTVVHEGWLDALLRVFAQDELTGMAGGKLLFEDGTLQEAGGIIWRNGDAWNYGRLDDPERSDYNFVREVDYVSAACVMIRRSLWEEIGGFDERYAPVYYEDTDLAFEVRDRGWKVMYQPAAVVTHFEGATHGTHLRKGGKRYQVINQAKFVDKWRSRLAMGHQPTGTHLFVARDRSRDRRHVLMIDHYVPQHDKDAGGRMAYHYIRLFVELGFHVSFLPANFERVEPYTDYLQQLGVNVMYSESAATVEDWIRVNAIYIDYACVCRPSIAPRYVDQLRRYGRATKLIYYPIDLHFLRELRRFAATGDPDALVQSRRWQEVEAMLFAKCDAVHALSPYEQEIIAQITPSANVRTIPAYLFDLESVAPARAHEERANILFVAGFEHSPNEDGLRWFVREVLPVIEPSLPGLEVVIAGEGSIDATERLGDPRVSGRGRVSESELLELYAQSRIAIVPLRYGAGIKGKLVEALHHGTPVVTTPTGAEGLPGVEDCASVAAEPEEFAARVLELYIDAGLWNSRVKRGRAYVAERFSRKRAREVLARDMALPLDRAPLRRSNGGIVTHGDGDRTYFLCNICGTASGVRRGQLQREVASCPTCNSTVRFRSVIHVLSVELFGESLVVTDFPVRKDIRGIGMSDWTVYATSLAEKLDYMNTFFDEQPSLDIMNPDDKYLSQNDFVTCSEVLEHVPPPVSPAFVNLRRLLKPGGLLVLTVPYSEEGATRENFPDLHDFKLVFDGDRKVLRNVTREGVEQRFENLTFHGGPGFTLEMRLFSREGLFDELEAAGFTDVKVHSEAVPEYGIEWTEPWSLPLTARVPAE
jgi:GT2 family glycosyltransferase/SAM-dependent methyltransferase